MALQITPVQSHRAGAAWIKNSARSAPPDLIVLHETAGATGWSSYEWGISKGTGYHFIIDRPWPSIAAWRDAKWDGHVWQTAPPASRTNHVGSTVKIAPSKRSINDRAIGISIANMSDGSEPRTAKQRAACLELIKQLKQEFPSLKYVTTHYDIQIWNRHDPLGFDPNYITGEIGLAYLRPSEEELLAAAEAWVNASNGRYKDERKFGVAKTKLWIQHGRKPTSL